MPGRSAYYKSRKSRKSPKVRIAGRKRGYIRKKQLRNRTSISLGLGFPKRMVMTHKYSDYFNLTSAAGVITKYLFSCNGMYDPNYTGGGHSPYYFSQMSALYNHYTVIGAKIRYIVTPLSTNEDVGYVGAWLDDDTTTTNITTVNDMYETTGGKLRQISPNANTSTIFNLKWSAKKTFGGSILGNDNLQGGTTTNPTEQTYFSIGAIGAGGALPDVVYQVLVEITYIAVWDELKQIARS